MTTQDIETPTTSTISPEAMLEHIRNRRSRGRVLQDPVPREAIDRVLEAATWAPNHHVTEPWRFWVVTGDARTRFGEALAAGDLARHADAPEETREQMRTSAIGKAMRAPVIIVVAAVMPEGGRNPDQEEVAAVSAAIQNMLLQAEAEGLGAIWRTGRSAYEPEMAEFLQLTPRDVVLGFVYLGYPDPSAPLKVAQRTPFDAATTWLG
jgi:nitroreductase